jgi:PTS system nitrogen regulatory IIA component
VENTEVTTTEFDRVAAWLQPEGIHLDVPLRDSLHALEFIATAIATHHDLDPAPVLRALCRREQAGSTGLGGGLAVPHARIPGIDRPLTLLVRARKPIGFKAPDHDPVRLMLAILVPEHGDRGDHLKLLALVAELFSDPRFRARIDTGADPAAVAASIAEEIARLR